MSATGPARASAYLIDLVLVLGVSSVGLWFHRSLAIALIVLVELYVAMSLLWAHTGRTPGAMALRIATVRAGTANAPGLKPVPMLAFGALHLTAVGPLITLLATHDGRSWLDKMAGTECLSLRTAVTPAAIKRDAYGRETLQGQLAQPVGAVAAVPVVGSKPVPPVVAAPVVPAPAVAPVSAPVAPASPASPAAPAPANAPMPKRPAAPAPATSEAPVPARPKRVAPAPDPAPAPNPMLSAPAPQNPAPPRAANPMPPRPQAPAPQRPQAPAPQRAAAPGPQPQLQPQPFAAPAPTQKQAKRKATLVQANGKRTPITSVMVIGRDPEPNPGEKVLQLADATMAMSRTHLRVGVDARGIWAEDAFSANGTAIVQPDGMTMLLQQGKREYLKSGVSLIVGEHRLWILQEGAK